MVKTMRRRNKIIPPNVLANRNLRRQYVSEPEPTELILVSSDISGIEVRGSSGLLYELGEAFYIDAGDYEALSDMIEKLSGTLGIKRRRGRPRKVINVVNSDTSATFGRTGQTSAEPAGKQQRGDSGQNSRSSRKGAHATGTRE